MNPILRIALFTSLIFVAFSCNKGCTTQKTIDSESATFQLNGAEITVSVRLIEKRRSRFNRGTRNPLDRNVTYTHVLGYDIESPWWSGEEVVSAPVDDPGEIVLGEQLNRFKLKMSDDQNHIAYGFDGHVMGVRHVLNDTSFSTLLLELRGEELVVWDEFDMSGIASSNELFRQQFDEEGCLLGINDTKVMGKILDGIPLSDTLHLNMLHDWPACNFSKRYYTDERVAKMAQDPTWKNAAIQKSLDFLTSGRPFGSEADKTLAFLSDIGTPNLTAMLDTMYLSKWGNHKGEYNDANKHFYGRLKDAANPLAPAVKQKLVSDAEMSLYAILDGPKPNRRIYEEEGMAMLLLAKEHGKIKAFLEQALTTKHLNKDYFDINGVVFDLYDQYPIEQQKFILEQSEKLFPEIDKFNKDNLFEFLSKHLDCSVLQQMLTDFPDALKHEALPSKCGS